jgi:hypothetical protein
MAGRIAAYSKRLMCLNGNAYWSMLIHIQDHATDVPSQFVEVQFSLPCNKSPEWLTRKSSIQKFRLTRNEDADSVLREFIDCDAGSPSGHTPEPCSHVPMWKRVPSAEHEKLPFGQRVRKLPLSGPASCPSGLTEQDGQLLKSGASLLFTKVKLDCC